MRNKNYKNLGLSGGKMTVKSTTTGVSSGFLGEVAAFFFAAWVVMIVWGALALEFATSDWTISYFIACAVTVVLVIIRRVLRR